MTRGLALLLILCPVAMHAQKPPLVGVWQVTYPAGMRIENDVETPIIATATLTIEAQGDSLIANLATHPSGDMAPRPPVRLAAKAGAGDATFTGQSKATLNINGAKREATAISTWVLRAKGDSLEGTVQRKIEGFDAGGQEPKAVTGTRQQG
jgi:hypothetical protein